MIALLDRRRKPESRKAGQDAEQIALVTHAGITHMWSFPLDGNVLIKPLDSSFRWNDDEEIDADR